MVEYFDRPTFPDFLVEYFDMPHFPDFLVEYFDRPPFPKIRISAVRTTRFQILFNDSLILWLKFDYVFIS